MLQKARTIPPIRPTEESSGRTTPKAGDSALSVGSPSSESDVSEATRDREEQYDRWLENMRVIENLREYVRGRLDRRDFSSSGVAETCNNDVDAMDVDVKSPPRQPISLREGGSSLYPRLPVPGS
jgi:hypothetical protein